MRTVTVLGAGNCGIALAAHLVKLNISERLWSRSSNNRLASIDRAGGITVLGAWQGQYSPKLLTSDMQEAVAGSALIAVTVPAHAYPPIARQHVAYLRQDQVVLLLPGRTCGALEGTNEFKRSSITNVSVGEAQTSLHSCRGCAEFCVSGVLQKMRKPYGKQDETGSGVG